MEQIENYVPGTWRCAKCGFVHVQATLSAVDGTIGVRDDPGEKCPNDGSPLWRMSWKQEAFEMGERAQEQMARALTAEAELATLRAAHAESARQLRILSSFVGLRRADLKAHASMSVGTLKEARSIIASWEALADEANKHAERCEGLAK